MTKTLSHLWRHPIKGIGAEALDSVTLQAGLPLPLDRAWAVLETGRAHEQGWQRCGNFIRGAKGPGLMAVTATVKGETIRLSHPAQPDLELTPDAPNETEFFAWLAPIYPENRPLPAKLIKAPDIGMADANFASVSILNHASLRALSQKAGHELDMRRFRGNLWLDGLAPWEEFDLVGKTLAIGDARLNIVERITRCRATEANPDTGTRDTATLQLLEEGWGHTDFGVYAKVLTNGHIQTGDTVTLQ